MAVQHLETLERRVKLKGMVEMATTLHVGAGRGMGTTGSDMPIMLDILGRPYIPGSSFKGALRAQVEAIARAVEEEHGDRDTLWSCNVVGEDYCVVSDEKNWDRKLAEILRKACPICRIFGAPYLASRLYVSDLMVVDETWDSLMLQVRDGVAIDRESLTAATRKKFDLEIVPPGVRFELELIVENPSDGEIGLLLWALDFFDQGYARLGGAVSRGSGRVRIILSKMEDRSIAQLFAALESASADSSSAEVMEPSEEERPETLPASNRLQEYLQRYLPALQRWIRGENREKREEEEGDPDV